MSEGSVTPILPGVETPLLPDWETDDEYGVEHSLREERARKDRRCTSSRASGSAQEFVPAGSGTQIVRVRELSAGSIGGQIMRVPAAAVENLHEPVHQVWPGPRTPPGSPPASHSAAETVEDGSDPGSDSSDVIVVCDPSDGVDPDLPSHGVAAQVSEAHEMPGWEPLQADLSLSGGHTGQTCESDQLCA
jgi:hypothetical protein